MISVIRERKRDQFKLAVFDSSDVSSESDLSSTFIVEDFVDILCIIEVAVAKAHDKCWDDQFRRKIKDRQMWSYLK